MRYRLFTLDERGDFRDFVEIEHPNDAAAIEAIERAYAGRAMELWQGPRHVHTVRGPDRASPSHLLLRSMA